MDRKLKGMAVGIVVFAAIFGLMAPVQATPSVYGHVYDTDGVTPVDGATVTVTDLNTGNSASTTTFCAGYYGVSLVGIEPGHTLKVVATKGALSATTTVTAPDPPWGIEADLTLQAAVPALTPIGIIALIGMLSVIAAISIRKRK